MPALVRPRAPCEVVVEIRVTGAENVAAVVRRASRARVGQGEAAVHDHPIGAPDVARQCVDVDERTECHRNIVAGTRRGRRDAKILVRTSFGSAALQSVLVGIKRVVDFNVRVRVNPDGSGMATAGLKMSINPFDEIAIEAALRLKEAGAFAEVVLATVGAADSEQQLRTGLAMGADRAIRVDAPSEL